MTSVLIGGLHIETHLFEFIENEVLTPPPGIEDLRIDSNRFWSGLEKAIHQLQPKCESLLQERESFQRQIDYYHRTTRNEPFDYQAYKEFLYKIGYLVDQGPDFNIILENVDPEIAFICGPQLVVPLSSPRFALNAVNARWGSLFDCLYSSDIIPETDGLQQSSTAYNPKRGAVVIRRAVEFLDSCCPLTNGSYAEIEGIQLTSQSNVPYVEFHLPSRYSIRKATLRDPSAFVGYSGEIKPDKGIPSGCFSIVLCHHDLHIELVFDKSDIKAKSEHPAGLKDVVLESALSVIGDCEDSVAVVDAEDKVALYRNWLGLSVGTLSFEMPDAKIRSLNPDRRFTAPCGNELLLSGRSIMLNRNVGHHMYTDIVTHAQTGHAVPEGFLDAFIISLIAMYDLRGYGNFKNSRTGSIYIVKPKQHGPKEVALTNELFNMVEHTLGLPRYTIKLGLMDEERRTSLNLKACIREADHRTIFINTGFLDRTGDEIHTSFELGPFDLKENLKKGKWIEAYEKQNVLIGLQCGMYKKAQIGKGMWAQPDSMKAMMEIKLIHPKSGATCAWVPSPKAATLHVIHYHQVKVHDIQLKLLEQQQQQASRFNQLQGEDIANENSLVDDLLKVQVITDQSNLSTRDIQKELDNNLQSILGYVVRWIDQGIGCSKIPDINGIGLMEDRATLRISSQHIANWLRHGIVTEGQVFDSTRAMAKIVDRQNSNHYSKEPSYYPMEPHPFTSIAYRAALDLVFKGSRQPNGYTEYILHQHRREKKRRARGEDYWEDSVVTPSTSRWSKM